jgi:putative inorganic carbon (HCO3(-)) transporter
MLTALLNLFHSLAPLAFYLATIAVFFVSAFWRPQIGVYYLAFFLPLENVRYYLHAFPFGEKFVDILLLGVFIGIFSRRNGAGWLRSPLTALLAVWGLMLYVSLVAGSYYLNVPLPISVSDSRFSDWKNYVEFFFFFLAAAGAIQTRREIATLLLAMGGCYLMVNRAFHGTMSGRDLTSFSYEVRDAGPLGGAGENGLAAFEATCLLFLTALLSFKFTRKVKLAVIGLMCTGVYCLLFTYSRGGYAAFVIGLIFLGLVKQRKLLVVVAVLLISWQALLPISVRQRITMTYDQSDGGGDLDQSAQTRVDLWTDAERLIEANPVFGTGFQTYAYMGRVGGFRDTHNYYVKILLETGAVGLLVFLIVVWRMFALGYQLYRRAEDDPLLSALGLGFATLMVGMIATNLFGDRWSFFQVDGWMWLLLGAVARGLALVDEPEKAVDEALELDSNEDEATLVPEFSNSKTSLS